MNKSKSVRIDGELYNEVEVMAKRLKFKSGTLLAVAIGQGLKSIKENGIQLEEEIEETAPKIDAGRLQAEVDEAAKKGSDELENWLSSITPEVSNALKYKIKKLRAIAKNADFEEELQQLPDLIKEGDRLSLRGRTIFLPWWDELSKEIRAKLEHTHWKKWRFDSGKADSHIRNGAKPLGYTTHYIHMQQQSGRSVAVDNARDLAEIDAEYQRAIKGTLIE